MDEIEQKGILLDQEKVTRVDFMFNAVRNTKKCTCIVRPRYLVITEIKLKLKGYKNEYKQITRQLCFDEMRNTAIRENYSLLIYIKHVPSLKPALCA